MVASLRRLSLVVLFTAVGCAPPTAPLYRDYQRPAAVEDARVTDRLERALSEAGWEVVESDHPGVVATAERRMRDRVIYHLAVSLEAVPVGDRHVRLFVHPYRRYVTGSQSKLFALDRGLRKALFPPLDEALEAYGFEALPAEDVR